MPSIFISELYPYVISESLFFFDTDANTQITSMLVVRETPSVRYSLLKYAILTGNDDLQDMHKKDGVKALL